MRILIASDNDQMAADIRAILARHDIDCPAGHVMGLDIAPDRVGRLSPELLLLVFSPDPIVGLKTLRDLHNIVPKTHTLVVGPATDPKLILKTLHDGADEFLDENLLAKELAEAMVRFKTKMQHSSQENERFGRVISILAPSGGCGASTLSANISIALAERHRECGLIDLRLSAGDLASMLNLKPTHTLADLCDNLARLDKSMFNQFFQRHSSGVSLLAAPVEFADIKKITDKGVRRTIAMARSQFPYIVIDLDNVFNDEQIEALWQTDLILLVLRLDYVSIRNTHRVLNNLTQLGIGVDQVQLVVNGYWQYKQLRVSQAEEALGMKIRHFIPYDPASVNQSINKGIPVVLSKPSSKISKSLRQLSISTNGYYPDK